MNEALLTSLREKKVGFSVPNQPSVVVPFKNGKVFKKMIATHILYHGKNINRAWMFEFVKPNGEAV